MWEATIIINNQTDCAIEVVKDGVGKIGLINQKQDLKFKSQQQNLNCYNISFLTPSEKLLMNGQLRFGSGIGVVVERGWIYEGDDTVIKMTAKANGKEFIQTSNGGRPLLNWDEFKEGGEINLLFENNI